MSKQCANQIGKVFGRLTVREKVRIKGRTHWKCVCACGSITIVANFSLSSGNTKSCGCLWNERFVNGSKRVKHWMPRGYRSWSSAKYRCSGNAARYQSYVVKGMYEPWLQSFEVFYADMGPCPPGHTLERKDNSIGYFPGNCVWANWIAQARNRKGVKLTPDKVRAMRKMRGDGHTLESIASHVGCQLNYVKLVVRGDKWGDVE